MFLFLLLRNAWRRATPVYQAVAEKPRMLVAFARAHLSELHWPDDEEYELKRKRKRKYTYKHKRRRRRRCRQHENSPGLKGVPGGESILQAGTLVANSAASVDV